MFDKHKQEKQKGHDSISIAESFPTEKLFTLPDRDKEILLKLVASFEDYVMNGDFPDYWRLPLREIRKHTDYDIWFLLAEEHVPQKWRIGYEEILESLQKRSFNQESLQLLQLHPNIDLDNLKSHGTITDEMLLVDVLANNNGVHRKHMKLKYELRRRKLAEQLQKYLKFPEEGVGQPMMVLALWNKRQWKHAEVDGVEEKNLFKAGGEGFQFEGTSQGEWHDDWVKAFSGMWPKRWETKDDVEETLEFFRKKKIRLSDPLKKALIFHPDRGMSLLLAQNQPLSRQELEIVFKRLGRMWYLEMDRVVIRQHVLGTDLVDILTALEGSKVIRMEDMDRHHGVWDGQETTRGSRRLAKREILKSEREMQGIPRWWHFRRRFQLWRNRHDQHDDGDVDMSGLMESEEEQEMSLSELLAEFEERHQS